MATVKTRQESVIVYRPDGVAMSYKVGENAMNSPGENLLGVVKEITMAKASEGNDYVQIDFANGMKTFSGIPYVHTQVHV